MFCGAQKHGSGAGSGARLIRHRGAALRGIEPLAAALVPGADVVDQGLVVWVHLDGVAIRSCQTTLGDVAGAAVATIEGLGTPDALHAVQAAWIAHQVAQCGYCQSGQMMQAASLLAETPMPTVAEIDAAMSGNLCRCGTYPRIRAAVRDAAHRLQGA